MSGLRTFFCYLFLFDLVKLLFPGKSGRISHLMGAEKEDFLGDVKVPGNSSTAITKS